MQAIGVQTGWLRCLRDHPVVVPTLQMLDYLSVSSIVLI